MSLTPELIEQERIKFSEFIHARKTSTILPYIAIWLACAESKQDEIDALKARIAKIEADTQQKIKDLNARRIMCENALENYEHQRHPVSAFRETISEQKEVLEGISRLTACATLEALDSEPTGCMPRYVDGLITEVYKVMANSFSLDADARRYRHLRKGKSLQIGDVYPTIIEAFGNRPLYDAVELDSAIDKAMKSKV